MKQNTNDLQMNLLFDDQKPYNVKSIEQTDTASINLVAGDNVEAFQKLNNIKASGLTIYDSIEIGNEKYWFTSTELTYLLNQEMIGHSFKGLPLRTRSKVAKSLVCEILGYPIPSSFKKVQPRFSGQKFDIYVQKSNNLQIWNEELDPERRYVLIGTDNDDTVSGVRVVTGSDLAKLDTTGTLTQKYQAKLLLGKEQLELISESDTEVLAFSIGNTSISLNGSSPASDPKGLLLMPISEIFRKLIGIIGKSFPDTGATQDRNRGAELHKLVCSALGYQNYQDNGQFPDVKHQLLEVKLQTSPTIDLGLVTPDSEFKLDIDKINGINVRHCDVRYAVFYAKIVEGMVTITHIYVTTGRDFFSRFTRFGGNVLNKKIQIRLPKAFFSSESM